MMSLCETFRDQSAVQKFVQIHQRYLWRWLDFYPMMAQEEKIHPRGTLNIWTDIPGAALLARLTKGARTSKAGTILWSTPVSGGFLQAGLLQSNVTVTISALPKLTIHWHRCTRECLHGVAPLKGQCAHCCEVVKQNGLQLLTNKQDLKASWLRGFCYLP